VSIKIALRFINYYLYVYFQESNEKDYNYSSPLSHFFTRSVKGINPLNNPLYLSLARDPHLRYTSARRLRTLGSMFSFGAFSSNSSAVIFQTKPEKGKMVKVQIIMTSQGGSPGRSTGSTGR